MKEGQIFSRIHVDDIVSTLECSMARPRAGAVYNVVDDLPGPGHEVITHACALLGVVPPPYVKFEEADLSQMARSFYSECRFLRNTLIKRELGVKLKYPTYHQGLKAQLAEENATATLLPAKSGRSVAKSAWLTLRGTSNCVLRSIAAWLPRPATPVAGEQEAPTQPRCAVLIVDNGSVRAASTLNLRRIADELQSDPRLSAKMSVFPVSARWSDRVRAEDLGGRPAELLLPALRRAAALGFAEAIILPLFFGPSDTVCVFCPEQSRIVTTEAPGFTVRIAPPLICPCPYLDRLLPPDRRKRGPDIRIAQIVCDRVLTLVTARGLAQQSHDGACANGPVVLLCDHGTPSRAVNKVRALVAQQLASLLKPHGVGNVVACSMERRAGNEYDFNDPLLENALPELAASMGDAGPLNSRVGVTCVVALLFLQPGKHAGRGGDIAAIVNTAMANNPLLDVHVTDVVGTDPLLTDVLLDRADQAILL